MTHNLLRAADTLDPTKPAVARGATLRRQIIHVPARLARPQRRPVLHLPKHWPWAIKWLAIWNGAASGAGAYQLLVEKPGAKEVGGYYVGWMS